MKTNSHLHRCPRCVYSDVAPAIKIKKWLSPGTSKWLSQCLRLRSLQTTTPHFHLVDDVALSLKTTPRCPSPTFLCDRASIMATLASSPPTSPSWPKRSPRAWALRCERYCCAAASCFPLAFVYGLTTWAVYVEASIGFKESRNGWIGMEGVHAGVEIGSLMLNP